jgi:GAF domain-containing protein
LTHHALELSRLAASRLATAYVTIGADEGTLWLLDETKEALVPVWNSGPRAEEFVGKHRQPLSAGLISVVCLTEQALCENEVYRHAGQDTTLDRRLGVLTCSMMAVPLRVGGEVRGVVSCVKLKKNAGDPDPAGFSQTDLEVLRAAVARMGAEFP